MLQTLENCHCNLGKTPIQYTKTNKLNFLIHKNIHFKHKTRIIQTCVKYMLEI